MANARDEPRRIFKELLQRLGQEYDKEVDYLHSEIARLSQDSNVSRPPRSRGGAETSEAADAGESCSNKDLHHRTEVHCAPPPLARPFLPLDSDCSAEVEEEEKFNDDRRWSGKSLLSVEDLVGGSDKVPACWRGNPEGDNGSDSDADSKTDPPQILQMEIPRLEYGQDLQDSSDPDGQNYQPRNSNHSLCSLGFGVASPNGKPAEKTLNPGLKPAAGNGKDSKRASIRVSVRNNLEESGRAGVPLRRFEAEVHPVWMDINTLMLGNPLGLTSSQPVGDSSILPTSRFSTMQRGLQRKNAYEDITSRAMHVAWIFTMDPTSRKRLVWDLIGIISLLYDIIFLPLTAFKIEETNWMRTLALTTTGYWTLDIVANMFCGYQTQADIEMNPKKIFLHYLRGWMAMDVGLVAADWVVIVYKSQTASFLRTGKLFSRGMRVVRMVRLVKLRRMMADLTDRIGSEVFRTMLRVLKFLVAIVLLNHYIACGWWFIGSTNSEPDTWVNHKLMEDERMGYQYVTSLHWSLTQFTPASMEVTPTNVYERTYSVCVLLFALVTFSSFVSIITGSVTQLQHIQARKLHNQVLLRRYLAERSISAPLVLRVCHFVHFYQRQQGGMERTRTGEDKVEALKMLPTSMITQIRWEAFGPTLLAHPLFYQISHHSDRAFKEVCSKTISEVSLSLAQELLANNTVVQQMIWVVEGTLVYSVPSPSGDVGPDGSTNMVDYKIEKDHWVCEAALWLDKLHIFGPFVAASCCDVFLLHAVEFRKIIPNYTDLFVGVACYSERFVEHVNETVEACPSHHGRWKSGLCNDFDRVQELAHLAFDSDARGRRSTTHSQDSGASEPRRSLDNHQIVPEGSAPRGSKKLQKKKSWLQRTLSSGPHLSLSKS